jgi:hypothetical protein
MSANANDVVCNLWSRCDRESRHLAEIRDEMKNLSESYFRYCELRGERERVRARLVKIYGVLGVFSPKESRFRKFRQGVKWRFCSPAA